MSIRQTPSTDQRSQFEERAQHALQDSAERLDGRTRSRLTQARHAALDALKQPQRKSISWLLPAGGAAAAAVLTVMLTLNSAQQSAMEHAMDAGDLQITAAPVEALEIATAEDSLEFYRDVEFYAWLDAVLEEEAEDAGGV